MNRVFGIFTLTVLPLLAAWIAFAHADERHLDLIGVLVFAWTVMIVALAHRFRDAREDPWQHADVLTGSGRAMMWSGFAAIVGASLTGWASLAVLGVLGIGIASIAATYLAIVAGGDLPWRNATVTRAILPATCTEGDVLREHVTIDGVRIAPGLRMFAQGRATAHGATTRYVVGAEGDKAELELESELGPAPRGEHLAPPLALWLGDVLGLARTAIVHRGEAAFVVLPKPARVDDIAKLLGDGGDAARTRDTNRFPTEGTFRIREYAPGDDTRRIHWVRSLQMNQLVVRLPDEIPQAEPNVRVVLDNCLAGTESLTCLAHEELLDAMVRVWLGVGNELVAKHTRVTLVTGVGGHVVQRQLVSRSSKQALALGARARWQGAVTLKDLLSKHGRQVVITCRARPFDTPAHVTWVVVPEVAWTSAGLSVVDAPTWMSLPYPAGSAENRLDRQRRERRRVQKMWDDRSQFTQLIGWPDWRAYTGGFCARPAEGRVSLVEVP